MAQYSWPRHFREALGSDSPMSEDLMSKVNITKKRIPVLSDLRTEALKERHWKQVKLPGTMPLVPNDIGMEWQMTLVWNYFCLKPHWVQKDSGIKLHWYKLTLVQNDIGTKWHWYKMTLVQNDIGTKWHWDKMTLVQNDIGTKWRWYKMTLI
jgi:hypothetical protein